MPNQGSNLQNFLSSSTSKATNFDKTRSFFKRGDSLSQPSYSQSSQNKNRILSIDQSKKSQK